MSRGLSTTRRTPRDHVHPSADRVAHGDCLEVLTGLACEPFDLAYLDPPFNTGRTHSADEGTYADVWPDIASYLEYMRARIRAVLDALSTTGVILLHCDWRTCHHFRLMLDELLGADRFVNHLIWSYGLGGSSPRRFARKHDDILFYARNDDYFFEPPMVPATSQRLKGRMKKATDVIEIPTINNMAAERVGYPTQKPLALLEMLLAACCPPRGSVIDPFCGSGTTLVAAARTGRSFLGIDRSAEAVAVARRRLKETAASDVD